MYTTVRALRGRKGEYLMDLVVQNINGTAKVSTSHRGLKIVRVDSLGSERDFVWIVNDVRLCPKKGDLLLFSGIDMRMPIVRRRQSDVMITVLSFSPEVFVADAGLIGLFYTKLPEHRLIRAGAIPDAEYEFQRLEAELRNNTGLEFCDSAALCHARLLLIALCRGLGFRPDDSLSPGSHIGEIAAYIGSHFTEKLTLNSAARALGISSSLLSKEMNRRLGVSFSEYVRRLRVNSVIEMMSGRGVGVMEAAYESGFTSMQGFYKTFRDITGMNPSEMLKSRENGVKN